MKLDGHIVLRFLTDKTLVDEILEEHITLDLKNKGSDNVQAEDYHSLALLLQHKGNTNYFITNTVLDKLELFDAKKALTAEGWAIFKNIPVKKKTFILPDGNKIIRMDRLGNFLYFMHMQWERDPGRKDYGHAYWILFWIDLEKGELCGHFNHADTKAIAPFIYALMCFIELSDNEEIIVPPGTRYGTRREGKIINILPVPITIVNSRWHITSIRVEGFPVKGHVRLQPCGTGWSSHKLIYIAPYEKKGYVRRAGSLVESVH